MDRTSDQRVYEFGDFRLEAGRRQLQLRADGRVLPLNAKAFDTLLLFLQRRGELLDKETLMKAVWPDVIVEENNLNQSISAVRRILGDTRDQHRYIVTIPGIGYQFVSDVKVLADEATPGTAESSGVGFAGSGAEPERMVEPATAAPTPVVPPVLATGAPPDTRGRRQRLSTSIARPAVKWAGVAAVLLVFGALMWVLGHRTERQPASQSAPTPVPESPTDSSAPRLAVLPFTNLSPEPANAFFADGLHEEIVSTLAERIPGIAVISRTTMMSYRQSPKPLGEVARELGATHVMEGTVRREGNQVRLTLQLVDAGTDRYLWSKTYDRALASAMTLQSEVAAEVAEQMSVRLASAVQTPRVTHDPEAYDLYLQALLIFRELGLSADLTTRSPVVEDLLNRALSHDPQFALAFAQRARLHTLTFISGVDVGNANYRSALSDLDAAERIAPQDPIVIAARAYFLLADGEIDRGLEMMQAAETAGLKDAEWLIPKTRMLLSRRRVDEAVRVHERMLSLDPAGALVTTFTIEHLLLSGRPETAVRVAKMVRDKLPEAYTYWNGYIHFVSGGDVSAYRKVAEPWMADQDALSVHAQVLRAEHRYTEIVKFLSHYPQASLAFWAGNEGQIFDSLGERPIAEYLGWAYLLLNDRSHAREQGRAVLAFAAKRPQTKWNGYFLRLLEAEAYTFTEQNSEAIEAAQSALELMPRTRNAVAWIGVASISARVFAWNGAGDEAVKLLEELTSTTPGLQPGLVAREPLFTVPLADHAQFRSLLAKLEEQMRNAPL
jgi:TolB-like protein/DNA-binding winged helix-turn-helix (wHTH) protein